MEEAPGYGRLAQILNELEIEFIDLLPPFRKAMRDEGRKLFWDTDLHWNSAGHGLAARQVVSRLVEKNLLPLGQSLAVRHEDSTGRGFLQPYPELTTLGPSPCSTEPCTDTTTGRTDAASGRKLVAP